MAKGKKSQVALLENAENLLREARALLAEGRKRVCRDVLKVVAVMVKEVDGELQ